MDKRHKKRWQWHKQTPLRDYQIKTIEKQVLYPRHLTCNAQYIVVRYNLRERVIECNNEVFHYTIFWEALNCVTTYDKGNGSVESIAERAIWQPYWPNYIIYNCSIKFYG